MKRTLLLIAAALITNLCFAQIPTPLPNTYVNDLAHVLTREDAIELNQRIFEIEKKSDVQLAIVLVKKIPAVYTIEDYSLLIGRKWHVGKNKTGMVYVASIQQHKQRIEVARGLDSVFTSPKCAAIMAAMKNSFRAKDYNGGLQILVAKVDSTITAALPQVKPQATAAAAPAATQAKPAATSTNNNLYNTIFWVVVISLIVLFVIYYRYLKRKSDAYQATLPPPSYNQPNYPANNPGPGYGPNYGNGYGNNYGNQYPNNNNSAVKSAIAGAAAGAALGYAARTIQDNMQHRNGGVGGNYPVDGNNAPADNGNDNVPDNWGNWGSGDSGSSDPGSSSDDSGFSESDSSSDSGATSDW